MSSDYRSEAARAYRAWYSTTRWRRRRAEQLAAEPLCRMCKEAGRITAATVADHVTPHRGDERLFWEGKLQSLCKQHHDSSKQREERRGYVIGCDESGVPNDPSHPWNRARGAVESLQLSPSKPPSTRKMFANSVFSRARRTHGS